MTRPRDVPREVREQAEARAAARAARDWATADGLRAQIEAAGWKVIDAGTAFRLEPVHPADVVAAGETRYGRSDAVPSRLAEPPTGLATAIVVAREDPGGARRAIAGLLAHAPAGVDVVMVDDGSAGSVSGEAPSVGAGSEIAGEARVEIVRTSAPLGQAASLNIGLRRARGPVVLVLDASLEPSGDVVTPLIAALDDPSVAVAGPFGLATADLRHFEEVTSGPAAAIEGYLVAFRRADAAERGPLDEAFRFYRNLDVWWSLVLRDAGEGRPGRAARVVEGLPVVRHEHRAWTATPTQDRDRLSKRNFYRVLERFRGRLDLAAGEVD